MSKTNLKFQPHSQGTLLLSCLNVVHLRLNMADSAKLKHEVYSKYTVIPCYPWGKARGNTWNTYE